MCTECDLQTFEGSKALLYYLSESYIELILPKYMYEDMIGTCKNNESNSGVCETYGYWSRTPSDFNGLSWSVYFGGTPSLNSRNELFGIRPVIKISKF